MDKIITPEEIKGFKKIEVIERPNDETQFQEDLKNAEENNEQIIDRDSLDRWAVYRIDDDIKICFYPYQF